MPDERESVLMLAIRHSQPVNEELGLRLLRLWGPPRLDTWGSPLREGALEEDIKRKAERYAKDGTDFSFTLIPPREEPEDSDAGETLNFAVSLAPMRGAYVGARETAHFLHFNVLDQPDATYATIWWHEWRRPLSQPSVTRRFLDACRRATDALDGEFAFGGLREEFVDETLLDARGVAWRVAYYGPRMVERIGDGRFRRAGLAACELDARGGFWTRLVEPPFAPTPHLEELRRRAAPRLRLSELWPPEPGPR